MKIPRFLLSAGASGSGKTLITCGILQALKNRGYRVASFKCGPDYIDPMFHTKVIGTKSRNLDTFFTGESITRYLLEKNSRDSDIAVMEGVMGYYDGAGGTTTRASAYELAKVTDTPVVLIVNCKGMSVSILPCIKGFVEFKKDSHIQGILLNQMSPMLYPRIKKMVEEELKIRVYGYVPKVEECAIESRHLGLVMPDEVVGFRGKLNQLAEILEKTLDLDGLIELAGEAPELAAKDRFQQEYKEKKVRIGLAKDEAFCFMYEDNLQILREMGAELLPFSPVLDRRLPENLDGLLLYGGYPELFGKQLDENCELRNEIRQKLNGGLPVMAECGGFMYLHDTFEDIDGNMVRGVGIIPGKAYKTSWLSRFGYITLEKKAGTVFGEKIGLCPAHEFHYFDSENCGEDFYAKKPESTREWDCIHCTDTMLAGFPHFYYYGNPRLAEAFIEICSRYKKEKGRNLEEVL